MHQIIITLSCGYDATTVTNGERITSLPALPAIQFNQLKKTLHENRVVKA